MTTIYLFDPVTAEFTGKVNNAVAFPVNSTHVPAMEGTMFPQYFVDGQWTFDNPNTPEVEKPVLTISDISLNCPIENGIWQLDTEQVAVLTATTQVPPGSFTAIVEKIVRGQPDGDLRFKATIVAGENGNTLSLPLYFKDTGNYQISAERLNLGLDQINQPFHVTFDKVDIDVVVAIPPQ